MIVIKHRKTGQELTISRRDWEDKNSAYKNSRDQWEIIDEGDPVIWVRPKQNGQHQELAILDREEGIRLTQKSPKEFSIIELEEGTLKPYYPVKKRNTNEINVSNFSLPRHSLSTTKDSDFLSQKGYTLQGLIGYIRKEQSQKSLSLVSRYLYHEWDDVINFIDFPGYNEQGEGNSFKTTTLGFVDTIPNQESIELFAFNNDEAFNSLLCTNPDLQLITKYGFESQIFEISIPSVYINRVPQKGYRPLYVWSSQPDLLFFTPLEEPTDKKESEKSANLLFDQVIEKADQDLLGRANLTAQVTGLVENLFEEANNQGAYTILLNGEWGSGKSSMLQLLETQLKSTNEGWKVIRYDAWENQQFKDPWWILINAISKQASEEGFDQNISSHRAWKIGMQYRNKIWAFALILTFIISFLLLFSFSSSGNENVTQNDTNQTIKIISVLIGIIGSIVSAIVGLTNNFFYRNISNEELKSQFAEHPFGKIRKRFDKIAENNKLAIFIDDLDRCEPEPTVKLLEGIQTLFKKSRVLYVIAADAQWLIKCFDTHYDSFQSLAASGHSIGERFLEKSFQLKVTVPQLKDEQFDRYYDELIGHKQVQTSNTAQNMENDSSDNEAFNPNNEASKQEEAPSEIDTSISEPTPLEVDKVKEELPKFLAEFRQAGVPQNPRQMKRFINQYIIMRATLNAEHQPFDQLDEQTQLKAVKYLLFTMQFPKLSGYIKLNKLDLNEFIANKFKDNELPRGRAVGVSTA